VSHDTGEVRKLTNGPNDFFKDITVSSDSKTLAAVQGRFSTDIWVGHVSDPNSFRAVTTAGKSMRAKQAVGLLDLALTPKMIPKSPGSR
jgi:hypothetical protein